MDDLADRLSSLNMVNLGGFLGLSTYVVIFWVGASASSGTLYFLAALAGVFFSPVFTSGRTDAGRYFLLSLVFVSLSTVAIGVPGKFLSLTFFPIAISAYAEFRASGFPEK